MMQATLTIGGLFGLSDIINTEASTNIHSDVTNTQWISPACSSA